MLPAIRSGGCLPLEATTPAPNSDQDSEQDSDQDKIPCRQPAQGLGVACRSALAAAGGCLSQHLLTTAGASSSSLVASRLTGPVAGAAARPVTSNKALPRSLPFFPPLMLLQFVNSSLVVHFKC